MPTYSYTCHHCGASFDARQSVDARDAAPCPDCVHLARRRFTPTPYIQVPEHFRIWQADLLPDKEDTRAWEARQGNSTSHAPQQETFKQYVDSLPRDEVRL